ncbi:hypothetical protein [uncultured Endozoicomonas sp.]|uniref:hypothetical protein n=1 Tax=uncultured Endozoicomonas sp. TaxID=432652 RepID=UPI00261F9B73|nr:hypothetical protein [uncultured Endozoicomonas sp.]
MDIQRLTVITDDQLVVVDNYSETMPLDLPEEIHAIQWQAGKGEVEYLDGRPNKPFTDLAPFMELIEDHARRKAEALKPPEPPTGEELAEIKKGWRNSEIQNVAQRIDQYKNDKDFGGNTFPYQVNGSKEQAALQLNSYRLDLITWTDQPGFEETEPPKAPEFWKPAPYWW